jgi:hypothetical protein
MADSAPFDKPTNQAEHVDLAGDRRRSRWPWILGGCIALTIACFLVPQKERDVARREFRKVVGLPAVSSHEKYAQGYQKGYAEGKESALEAIEYHVGRDAVSPSAWAGDPGSRQKGVTLHGLEYVTGYEAGYSNGFREYFGR